MLDGEEFEQHRWRVLVLADAARQPDLVQFLRRYRGLVAGWSFLAIEATAAALRAEAGLRTVAIVSGTDGRDGQLHERIESGEIDALIVLADPLRAQAETFDVRRVLCAADALNVPVATNLATAHCLAVGLVPTESLARASR
jgi:methylglyoxal synthase